MVVLVVLASVVLALEVPDIIDIPLRYLSPIVNTFLVLYVVNSISILTRNITV